MRKRRQRDRETEGRRDNSVSPSLRLSVPLSLLKAVESRLFVLVNLEDGQQLRDHEQVFDFLREVEQLQAASGVLGRRVARDQLAYARAVDVADSAEVEDDLVLARIEQFADGVAQLHAAFADGDLAEHFQNDYIAYSAFSNFQLHRVCVLLRSRRVTAALARGVWTSKRSCRLRGDGRIRRYP